MVILPVTQFIQFEKLVDPSGARNILASGIKELNTSANGFLDFGNNNVSISGIVGNTRMVIFRASSMGDASGIYNLKFYLQSLSAFGQGTLRFLHRISTHYLGDQFVLNPTDVDIPTSVPATQNLFSTQGVNAISGTLDPDVSQYIYLAVFTDVDVPFGTYGPAGFRYRCQYDFS
jgi:hypothetical protein